MSIKVSIIIPVYNGSNYMREAIDSALAQSYENIEIIVVNDGSRDDGATREVALSYGDRIKYYEKPNGGCASALNYGISKMTGEWFSWLSHDDKYHPDKVKRSIDIVHNQHLEEGMTIVNCASDLIDENGDRIFHPSKDNSGCLAPVEFLNELFFGMSINGCALLIHKKALKTIGKFDETLTYTPDFDYWIRAAICGCSLFSFNDSLCSNRVHSGQVSVQQKHKRESDVKKQLQELPEIINSSKYKNDSIRIIWLYVHAKGYKEFYGLYDNLLRKTQNLTIQLRLRCVKQIVKSRILVCVKYVYRAIFKKGMD